MDGTDLSTPFDVSLWASVMGGAVPSLPALVAATQGSRAQNLVFETVIVEGANPLDSVQPADEAEPFEVHTSGDVTVMRIQSDEGPFTVSAWPSHHEGVFHLIGSVPATDRRWKKVDRWIRKAAPKTVRCFLDHEDFIDIGTALSEFDQVEVVRASGRMRSDRSSYNRGWPVLAGDDLRMTHFEAISEFENAGASVRSLTLHVGEVMDVTVRRVAGATFSHGDFSIFENVVLQRLALAASTRRQLMSNRERHVNEPAPASIQVRLPAPTFHDAASTGDVVTLFERTKGTSFAVMHRNPYLHVVVTDEVDGSNFDVFVTQPDVIEIRPGFRATMGSLSRISHLLGERFEAQDMRETPTAQPVSVYDLIDG